MSMGISPDSKGGEGLGGTESGAAREERSIEKGVGRAGAEHTEVTVVDWSMDWNASFANCTWSILWAAAYQASRSVSVGRLKDMVAI